MDWVVYHVEGHTSNGYFVTHTFDNMEDVLAYWECTENWQDGEIAAEYFIDGQYSVEIFWRKGF